MASSYTDIGTELMATGENAGVWGTKTNTNLQILEEAINGYVSQALTSGGTVTLTYTDGSVGDVARHAVIALTGSLSGNAVVEVPANEKIWIIDNQSTNAYTVTVRVNGQSGVTWGTSDKGTKILYANGTDVVDTNIGGGVGGHDLNGEELILDADADTSITADTDDQIDIKIAGADDFQFTANTFTAQSGSTIAAQALTTTTITASGIVKTDDTTEATSTTDGSLQTDGGLSVAKDAVIGDDLKLLSDSAVLSFGADSDVTVTHDPDDGLFLKSAATGDDNPFLLTLQTGETDIAANDILGAINFQAPDEGTGTDAILVAAGIEAVSEGDFSSSSNATKLSFKTGASEAASEKMSLSSGGNLTISGDLTVSGDDITMGTNTAGNLLVADGTNFNSIAAGSLSEISTVAGDDVLLAVDSSGGGLKNITRSTLTAGLVSGSEISNVVEDTSPQLGANLDTNSHNILIDDAHFIADENGNEQIIFQTTGSAVNQFDVTNAATGNPPSIKATGGDSNFDFDISAKGTGHVTVLGGTNSGAIQFNCESNSHGQIVIAQPHSAAVTNTLTLPAGSSSTLVSLVSTDTLTNKTLTTPVIAEIDSGADITLDATADIILDAGGNDWSFKSGGTEVLKITNSSSDVIIKPIVDAKDIIFQQRDGTEVARVEDNATFNFVTDKLAINGTAVTSTAAELNLLDGVSGLVQADLTKLAAVNSTDAELNLLDGSAKSTSSITLADSDAIIVIDGTTTKQIPASDLKTYNPGGTSWQAVKTANFTASAGQGVFCNTTDSAFTITLPAGTIGDEVSIVDYAGTFDSNNLTVAANGSEKIHGSTDDLTVALERASFTLVFTDSTQGWLLTNN